MGRGIGFGIALVACMLAAAPASAKPGDLIVGDNIGDIIRVNPRTGAQDQIATSPAFSDASGLAFTRSGQLLVADYDAGPGNDGLIFRVNPRTGSVAPMTLSGGTLEQPVHLELLANGSLYVPDFQQDVLARINPRSGALSLLGGEVLEPYGIDQLPNATLVMTSLFTPSVLRVNPNTGATQPIASGPPMVEPLDIDVAPNGRIYVIDNNAGTGNNGALIRINPRTGAQQIVAEGGLFSGPTAVGISPNGNAYVTGGSTEGSVFSVNLRTGAQDVVSPADLFVDAPEGLEVEPPRCGGKVATIVGSAKADRIRGSRLPDVIAGLGGADVLRGLKGNDRICGGKGRDRLIGGKGRDKLRGGPGRDFQRQ